MVLESLVVDLLNRFLGDYVVNLDRSQLRLGIWGGDVVLENLEIKESALSDLDVPFLVKVGFIGRLTLKIPWKNLYNDSVMASLEDLHLLIVPTTSVKYDAQKEKQQAWDAKQRELQRIDQALQKTMAPGQAAAGQDSFAEKLATQVVKNLQITISGIHLRYEDDVTYPTRTLALGFTLGSLSFQTAGEDWKPSLLNVTENVFNKLVNLDCLAAYCNVNGPMFFHKSPQDVLMLLRNGVASKNQIPSNYHYIFRPVSGTARLAMSPRTDLDLSRPKIKLELTIEEVAVELMKTQYLSAMELLESIDRVARNAPYRKYRPEASLHGNSHLWWQYAITSVRKEMVERKLRMWSWSCIRRHREKLKQYKDLYMQKLSSKKPSEELLSQLRTLEEDLDVLNIVLGRRQAESQVLKQGRKLVGRSVSGKSKVKGGWFGSWWSKKEEVDSPESSKSLSHSVDEMLGAEERTKLYTAIGYSASTAADPTLPHEYVAHSVHFHLMSASFAMLNGPHQPPLLKIQLLGFLATLSQRPSAGAIKFETSLEYVHIIGKGQADGVPHLLTSQTLTSPASNTGQTPASTALLHFAFETNPLDRKADQRLSVAAQPLELVYDAQTVLALVEFLHVPNPPQLDQLAATTVSKLQDMKEMTTAGVQHMIQTQRVLDLSIELKASYLLVPSGGFFQKNCSLLILDFGNLQMSSVDRGALLTAGSPSLSPEELMEHVYERFHLHLSHLQLLYCNAEVDWKSCRTLPTSPYHVLEPLALHFGLARCLTSLNPRMPRFTILGELPLLKVRMMDTVLKSMYDLMASIPLPSLADSSAGDKTETQEHGNIVHGVSFSPAQNNLQAFTAALAASPMDSDSEFQSAEESLTESGSCDDEFADPVESVEVSKAVSKGSAEKSPQNQKPSETETIKQNMIDLQLKFEITKVLLELCRQEQDKQVAVLQLDVQQLGGEVTVHTWHLKAVAYLHTLAVHSFEFKDEEEPLSLVQSGGTDSRLLSAEYIKVNQDNPEFETTFNSREQLVKVCFSSLDLRLQLEALLQVWSFLSPLLVHAARPSDQQRVEVDSTDSIKASTIMPIKMGSKKQLHSLVDFEIEANLEAFSICICDKEHIISDIYIKGLEASVQKQSKQTVLNASLKDILVLDSDPNTIHNKVVCITGKEVFNLRLCLYEEEFDGVGDLEPEDVPLQAGAGKIDGRVELHVGCIKVIHSAQFFSALLAFSDNFQTAKAALSAATAQAAERAAEGVKVLAQRSSQYVLMVNLKAPVIIFPADQRAIVADLGLITINNRFTTHCIESMTAFPAMGNNGVLEDLPIIDNINIHLADLKVYRVNMLNGSSTQGQSDIVDEATGSEVVLLEPVTLDVLVKRNLSSAWFQDCPDVAVKSQLRAIKIFLSQDDLRLSLKAMWESLGNKKHAAPPSKDKAEQSQKKVAFSSSAEPSLASPSSQHVNFMLDCELPSLQLALLQVAEADRSRDEEYRLGEVSLSGMSASFKMDTNDKIKACVTLQSFTLEDQRPEMTRISSRVVTLESTRENGVAADICWTRETDGDVLESTFQRVYVCGSLDFLISVSHFFLDDPAADVSSVESLKESEPEKQHHIVQGNLKAEGTKSSPGTQSITVIVHVESPELVFVADMSRADAPAIVATMECHGSLRSMPEECNYFLVIRGLRLTAMAFLKECREDITATVLHPCDLYIKSSQAKDKPPFINFVCASLNLRVSPVIINTIMSIFAAMTMSTSFSKTSSLGKDDVEPGEAVCEDLWEIKALGKDYQPWYLEQKEPRKETKDSWSHTQAVGSEAAVTGEQLQLSLESFVVTLEGGVGNQTTPLLLAEAGVMGSVQNWRSFPSLQTSVTLQVSSFNEVLGVWEPLVEPIQTPYSQSKPWSLNLKLCQTGGLVGPQTIPGDEPAPPLALTEMTVSSEDSLNLTVTTRGLEVMTTLLKAFSEATKGGGTFGKDCAPLVVTNALGIAINLSLGADICVFQSHKHYGKKAVHQPVIELSAGECIELDFSKSEALGHTSVLLRQESTVFSLSFTPAGYSAVDGVPLGRLGSRVYSVYPKDSTSSGDEPEDKSKLRTMLVCNIESQDGVRYITIRSLLQVINHCGQSFKLLHRTGTATYETIGIVPSTGEFCVPLIYASQQLYLAPDSGEYETSTTYVWGKSAVQKVFEAGKSGILWVVYCPSTQPGNKPLWLSVRAQPDTASFVDCSITGCAIHALHLSSTVCLRNFLPYSISCLLEGVSESQVLDSGHAVDLMQAGATSLLAELTLKGYQGRTWRGKLDLNANPPEYLTITFLGDGWGEKRAVESVTLALHSSRRDDQLMLTLFAPYWLVNKTGRLLQYRPDSSLLFRHPSGGQDPILYTHQPRGLFSKNKMKVSVGNSSFSGDFSLDTVGSSGCLYCKVNQHVNLQVGVKIQMSSWGLTKIVTFTPFFVFINKSSLELEVMEEGTRDSWIYLPPNELSGFWPVGSLKQLRVRKMGTNTSSKVFNFSHPDGGTVLRLPEKPGGVHVDITVVENSAVINFSDLQPGTAPLLLVNHLTGRALEYNQVGCEGQRWLLPEQAVFYTWDEPCKDRRLRLSCEDKTLELDPLKNGDGVLPVDVQAPLRWACFLDGMQRVFVLTSDVAVVARARDQGLGLGAGSEGEFLQKIDIALNEMTVSLVNSNMKQEIAFVSFTSSGIIWEEKRHRWKPLKLNLSDQLEKEYKHTTEDKVVKETKGVKRFSAGSNFEFELSTDGIGRCLRPYSCPVRRSFIPAFSMTYQAWSHQRSLEVKLFRLQVDNQLPGAIFSTVFNPLAPPKSIALDSVPKSFVDMSAVVKCNEHSSIMQIRYLKVLIQEMGVQLDARFLNAFLQTIYTTNSSTLSPQQKIEKFHEDLQLVGSDLPNQSFQDATSTLLYLEFLHFSPLKLHLSLSLSSTGENEGKQQQHEAIPLESLNLLLQNLGATLADSQDLVFKMACFEVKHQFYTENELMWAVIKHYSNQFLQQLYVVVLGLDVLGNPFGLLRGLSQGVESLFYEPYQGAIQGPEEFAEGMAIGVKSFFGHAVGGAAGVVSRLTGTVGKGLAAITMDEEFQQKRQEDKNRQAQNFKSNLARGGKGLLQGVVGGVTGIITKPVEGAKKEGAAGFFKGIGKGLVGVVARPTGGVVDMASSTLEGLKRVAESSENIHRVRPPRVIRADGIVRPFTSRESEANLLLQTAEDGQYSSDRYFAHVSLSPDNVKLVLITNRRLMLLKRDVLEQLDCVWQYPLETVMTVACQNERVTVFLKTDKAQNVFFPDARTAEWFVRKLEEAQLDWREQKMQPGTS